MSARATAGEKAGLAALALLGLLAGGALAGLVLSATRQGGDVAGAFDSWLWSAARFTLWQAALSTLLSVLPAVLVARALFRHRSFPGRGLILGLFALPLAIPGIVAALATLMLYGRAGLLAPVLAPLADGQWPGVFGLSGILLAHVFFNLPLAARMVLEALEAVPADRWRLAAQLGMGPAARFRLIEWPALASALPGIAGLVFMLCATSFAVVLTLGGGPSASTLEVAIYQALRFDFDPARAAALTLTQLALTGLLVAGLQSMGAPLTGEANLMLARRGYAPPVSRSQAVAGILVIAMAAAFVGGPLAAMLLSGLQADLPRLLGEAAVRQALATSLALALASALLAVALTLALLRLRLDREKARRRGGARGWSEWAAGNGASLILLVPPIVIGAGWFILAVEAGQLRLTGIIGPALVATVNAAMAMPFVMRLLGPAHDMAAARHDRLAANLGLTGWTRLRLIDLPALKGPLAAGFAFAMALSLGDLGVIALFGSEDFRTLPWLLHARMGSYRTDDAAGLALILALSCLALMMVAARAGRVRA
ncbi:thiamine/thiamine pyrophosphate ABC transporter permease [Zhengella sp. ZM62]|uniref:thiamine/thiamine pyrophosphate ABC transporter permease n=1 Tax=Zhengella sedimenti TaxID=3390035 RepID=UPI003974CB0C